MKNIKNKLNTLTVRQKLHGQKRYLQFIRTNAFSFSCLAESILILYAMKLGANDFFLGILTSFFFLTMPFMVFGKKLVGKIGAAHSYAMCWIFRNLSASLMILAPILMLYNFQHLGMGILFLGSFGFFAFRSMGTAANTPLIGEITSRENRGKFISTVWMTYHSFYLVTIFTIIALLSYSDSIYIFQGVIAIGVLAGLISAFFVYQVPESENPRLSGQQSIAISANFIWKNSKSRKLLFAWIFISCAIILTGPFSMVALKNGYHVCDRNALFFSIFQTFGGVCASYFNSRILDRAGPRPVLQFYGIIYLSICLLWMLAPFRFYFLYPAFIFFLIGVCRAGAVTALSHYFLIIIPEKRRVGANMLILIISGLSAGLVGSFWGGGLLKVLHRFEIIDFNIYRIYFLIILFCLIPLIMSLKRLERLDDWHFRKFIRILLSLKEIQTLFTLHPVNNSFMNTKMKTDKRKSHQKQDVIVE